MSLAPVPLPQPGSVERSRLTVTCGPLARSLAGRFVAALGAETELAVDRVDEACLVAEAVADRCQELTPDGELELTVTIGVASLELRVGPMAAGSVARLLGADASQFGGGVIRRLANAIETRRQRSGGELLVLAISAQTPDRPVRPHGSAG